ncbi:hypothetical protein BE221DRAFT_64515 [Ostreococcus tauri]|uniref:RRM domain-containing protein n=1 Tax=Ostreococcus tauri TaxID=70448 RepID=A0A1Y5I188_OSTTA|nr:hypothetical protein BE221DRAFT_64515 [Ostreococcus tauri]
MNSSADGKNEIFRLHLRGLSPTVSRDDILLRFHPFGDVQSVEIMYEKFSDAPQAPRCRGFAYISMSVTRASLERCMSTYNGCAWKGRKFYVSEALPHFEIRRQIELLASSSKDT